MGQWENSAGVAGQFDDWAGVSPVVPWVYRYPLDDPTTAEDDDEEPSVQYAGGALGIHAVHLHTGHLLIFAGVFDQRRLDLDTYDFDWIPLTSDANETACLQQVVADGQEEGVVHFIEQFDLFCAGHSHDGDGRLVVGGGNYSGSSAVPLRCTYALDPSSVSPATPVDYGEMDPLTDDNRPPTSWEGLNDYVSPRWYPTVVPDAHGSLHSFGGGSDRTERLTDDVSMQWITVGDPDGPSGWAIGGYPMMFLLPGGNFFYAGRESGNPSASARAGHILRTSDSTWLPAEFASDTPGGSAVMYAPGRILKSGGGDNKLLMPPPALPFPATTAEIIDLSDPCSGYLDDPGTMWQQTGPMHFPRHFHTLTVLPDGNVLATGGNTQGNGQSGESVDNMCEIGGQAIKDMGCGEDLQCPPAATSCNTSGTSTRCLVDDDCEGSVCDTSVGTCRGSCRWHAETACDTAEDCPGVCDPNGQCSPKNNACYATKAAELWNPSSGDWCLMAEQQFERMYHSTALLLPDGRVISMGNGRRQGLRSRFNAEFFRPPYLTDLDANPRPEVAGGGIPTTVTFGSTFNVELASPTDFALMEDGGRVTLVRLGAVTHQVDMGQRFHELCWQPGGAANTLTVTAPADGSYAPPGYYMLFVLSNAGVPSIGQYVRVEP
ncbi:MAG: galactose oxidase early set domain-containing protein [Myxococcota bacterium]